MAAAKKKLDERHASFLRELSCLTENKYCFDCNQRGPTYVNMTIGAFVCTACSGLLRGLNPPHRVKSISMGNFSPEEMEILKSRGNWFCKKTWLSLHDNNSMVDRAQNQLRDFLAQKYEKRLFYSPPTPDVEAQALRENSEAFERAESGGGRSGVGIRATVGKNASKSVIIPSSRTAGSAATTAVASSAAVSVTVPLPSSTAAASITAASSSFGMPLDFAANLFDSTNSLPTGAQPSSSFGSNGLSATQKQGLVNFDAFSSVGSGALPPGFGGSPLFAIPSSSSAAAEPVKNSAQNNLGGDRYAAFADLDGLFGVTPTGGASSSVGTTRSVFENAAGTTGALNRYTSSGATSLVGDSVASSSGGNIEKFGNASLNWGASCNTNIPGGSGWSAFGTGTTGGSAQRSLLGQPGVSGAAAVPGNPFSNPNPFASSSMAAGAAAAPANVGWGQSMQPYQANFAWNWSSSSGGTSAANPFANGTPLIGSSSSAAASGIGFVNSASSTNPFL